MYLFCNFLTWYTYYSLFLFRKYFNANQRGSNLAPVISTITCFSQTPSCQIHSITLLHVPSQQHLNSKSPNKRTYQTFLSWQTNYLFQQVSLNIERIQHFLAKGIKLDVNVAMLLGNFTYAKIWVLFQLWQNLEGSVWIKRISNNGRVFPTFYVKLMVLHYKGDETK